MGMGGRWYWRRDGVDTRGSITIDTTTVTITVGIPLIVTVITQLIAMGTTGRGITAPGTFMRDLAIIVHAATIIGIAAGDCATEWGAVTDIESPSSVRNTTRLERRRGLKSWYW